MKISELKRTIPNIDTDPEVNATVALENHFFGQKTPYGVKEKDYRTRAIECSIAHGIPITNTPNNTYELMELLLQVRCPKCGEIMKLSGGGGNGSVHGCNWRCEKDGTEVYIGTPTYSGMSVTFKQEDPNVPKP
jgi:hypothetical protein